jgi:hypothetical protein
MFRRDNVGMTLIQEEIVRKTLDHLAIDNPFDNLNRFHFSGVQEKSASKTRITLPVVTLTP